MSLRFSLPAIEFFFFLVTVVMRFDKIGGVVSKGWRLRS